MRQEIGIDKDGDTYVTLTPLDEEDWEVVRTLYEKYRKSVADKMVKAQEGGAKM